MNLFAPLGVVNGDFCWGYSHVWAILLMQGVDVVDSTAGQDSEFKPEICQSRVPWAWNIVQRVA